MQPDLLSWRGNATTSGPRPTAADGAPIKATSRQRWDAWMALHSEKLPEILAEARRRIPRVSAKAVAGFIRAYWCVPFNNSATAGLGEWLSEHEDLRPFVERRGKAMP